MRLDSAGTQDPDYDKPYPPPFISPKPYENAYKIWDQADWLYDAIQELDGSSPDRLIMAVSPRHPFFSLSSAGPMGSTSVEFSNDRSLLETFQVPEAIQNTYVSPIRCPFYV